MRFKKKLVFETEYWRVGLAEEQTYLGYCVVVLKRQGQGCGDLADLTREEEIDFFEVVKIFEKALRGAFDATMFNWSCLMNHAYQLPNPEPHMHWHVKPRYNHPVEFEGELFEDSRFGHHYLLLENLNRIASDEMQNKIIARIQEHLPS